MLKIDNFFTFGFVHDTIPYDVVKHFENDIFIDCNSPEAEDYEPPAETQKKLDALHLRLGNWILAPVFRDYDFKGNGLWNGVDDKSSRWHNDFEYSDGFNSNILVYMEDNEPYGNNISVTDGDAVFTIYPKRNEFVWLNQSNKAYRHKAHHAAGPRRLLSFEFMIHDLNYGSHN